MRIAELEAHHDAYSDSERTICAMVDNREFPAVFLVCCDAFPHVVPAIKYRKKREIIPETPKLMAFTTICKYAPPLFEHAAIESLLHFVKSTRFLAQHEKDFLSSAKAALVQEQLAQKLWNHLEKQPGMLQRNIRTELGVIQEEAVKIIELWDMLGIIYRQSEARSYRLHFRTHLDAEVFGRCPNCDVRGKGRKDFLFRSMSCQKCGTEGYYHIEFDSTQ